MTSVKPYVVGTSVIPDAESFGLRTPIYSGLLVVLFRSPVLILLSVMKGLESLYCFAAGRTSQLRRKILSYLSVGQIMDFVGVQFFEWIAYLSSIVKASGVGSDGRHQSLYTSVEG